MERRKFIKKSISFAALIALHRLAQSCSSPTKVLDIGDNSKARFSEVVLYTSKLKEQLNFYTKVLGFALSSQSKTEFSLKLGESILRFKEVNDGSEPFYHFAINIPSNKHKKAYKWLSSKTEVLVDDKNEGGILYFDFWDAHAMYFKDPAGNIGELIARHTLDNDREGEFTNEDLLCISEIGTPVENPDDFGAELKARYELEDYAESMFIGDENGVFVVVPIDRPWFPEFTQNAAIHPTEIHLAGNDTDIYKYKDYPYKIH